MTSRPSVFLSVVLPVYNELEVLDELHGRLVSALEACECSFEILFVDDGSTDGTTAALQHLAERHHHISVVRLSRNWGHAAALKAGIDLAAGECVVVMDADLQDQPELIPRLLEEQQRQNADVVYVVRTRRAEPFWIRGLFRLFHWSVARTSTSPLPRDSGTFGLIGPRALAQIRRLDERLRYFPGLRAYIGLRQVPLPAPRAPRYDRRSRVGTVGLIRLATQAFFSQSRIPAITFYWLSAMSFTVAIGLIAFALVARVLQQSVPAWSSTIIVVSAFSAILILGLALAFEYLARIYEEVRARPIYLVDSIYHASSVSGIDDAGPATSESQSDLAA
jgi:dolichol-phosphate mannosyltransferase